MSSSATATENVVIVMRPSRRRPVSARELGVAATAAAETAYEEMCTQMSQALAA